MPIRINVTLLSLLLATAVATGGASVATAREPQPDLPEARLGTLQATPAPATPDSGTGTNAASHILLRLFGVGAAGAAFGLLTFAAYKGLRGHVRSYIARLRNRRLHQDWEGHRPRGNGS